MAIPAGTTLGHYEIHSAIGSGGMGEVYEARDTKLGRNVAVKVLPAAFVNDSERLARFQREARMLAALNHPNIATIYGLECSDAVHFLIMELVPGETLAARVMRGPVPMEEALKFAVQIAEALEAAHEKGIIHRDLKPANVKVTPDGKVKVLDFGLAKAFTGDTERGDPTNSPTLSMAATMQGVILGTAAYMSPEQSRGRATDNRTDIWAFGCVLYELLTGKRAFQGETAPDIIAKILTGEPDWKALPQEIPFQIRALLKRCLQKDKTLRLQAAGDARIEIQEALAAPREDGATQARAIGQRKAPWAVAAGLALLLAIALWGWWRTARPIEPVLRPLVRLNVDIGADLSDLSVRAGGASAILSPDGMRVAYVSQGRLFTRRLDQPNATELVGTQNATSPFFSPDGQWIAFFAEGRLKKTSVDNGTPITLCSATAALGGSWGDEGTIIASLGYNGPLFRIPSAGGTPTPVTDMENGENTHRWPQILPGSKAILFTSHTAASGAFDGANIEVMSLADHHTKTLVRGGSFGRYVPSGHLLYVNRRTLFAVPFDLDRLEVHGAPASVLDQVGYNYTNGSAQLDFSQTGTLLYQNTESGSGLTTVQWLDSAGKTQPVLARPGAYVHPSISPDGERLAFSGEEGGTGNSDIWVYDWKRDTMTRLTFGPVSSTYPVWSADGRYILFEAPGGMFWTRSDGSGKPQQLTQSKNSQFPWSVTSDGKKLAFIDLYAEFRYGIWTISLEDDGSRLRAGKPEPYLLTSFDERHPFFSPDERWVAYTSSESGTYQVYVRAFPDQGGKWQISSSGGLYPIFSRNGRELFYRSQDNQIMVASYTVKGDSFVADKPRVWSEKKVADIGLLLNYDVAPDGKRVVALMPAEEPKPQLPQSHVIFLENFFDELRRRVPTGK